MSLNVTSLTFASLDNAFGRQLHRNLRGTRLASWRKTSGVSKQTSPQTVRCENVNSLDDLLLLRNCRLFLTASAAFKAKRRLLLKVTSSQVDSSGLGLGTGYCHCRWELEANKHGHGAYDE